MTGIEVQRGQQIALDVVYPPTEELVPRRFALAQIVGSEPEDYMHIPGEIDGRRIVCGMRLDAVLSQDFPEEKMPTCDDLDYTFLGRGATQPSGTAA